MSQQQKWTNKLKGTRVLIIGGTSGVGFGVAEASLEHDVSALTLASSSMKRVEQAVEKLKRAYPASSTEISGHTCDLADEPNLDTNVRNLFSQIGIIDHIIFTAGDAPLLETFAETDFATIKQAGMVRFFAPLLVARYGLTNLSPGPASSITLTTGVSGEKPLPDWTVTSSYLSGLQGMMRGLALDLKPIRVNLVSLGGVDTEMWNVLKSSAARNSLIRELAALTTTGQVGTVENVVEAYLYCMKDHNLTGSLISTNGGRLLL